MKFHPACKLFPDLSPDAYKALVADIKENGCHTQIVMYKGAVLDGRHRWKACQKLGIKPPTRTYQGDGPTSYAISLNLHRRSLTVSQRAAIAADSLPMIEKESERRQKAGRTLGSKEPKGRSAAIAAEAMGVSESSVKRAKARRKKDPKAHEAVKKGRPKKPPAKPPVPKPKGKRASTPMAKYNRAVAKQEPITRAIAHCTHLTKLLNEINTAAEGYGGHVHEQTIRAHLKNLRTELKQYLPHAACPVCGGRQGCKVCNNTGWVNKFTYEACPD